MRRHGTLMIAVTLAAAVSLVGCATTPPTPTALPPSETSSSPTPTLSTASPAPTPTATPTPTLTPTVTPTPTPTPTPTKTPSSKPSKSELLLTGAGLGGFKFGAKEAAVEAMLNGVIGKPDSVYSGAQCELDSGSPWARALSYGGLSVLFVADVKSKTAPRYLRSWSLGLEGNVSNAVKLQDDLPTDLSFAQLKKKYPKGTLEDSGLGDGTQIFTHPDGIRYLGLEYPDLVQGGEIAICE